jgi:DNA primase large subunit
LHFTDYLRYAPSWSDTWKLVNMPLEKGWVHLELRELARVLQNAIQQKLLAELQVLDPPAEVRSVFNTEIVAIQNALHQREVEEQAELGAVSIVKLPPCMRMLLAAIQSGTNVPHVGRFTLVSFLHTIGMNTEEILGLFATSPDFDQERTRYQIEHITGKASGTDYTPPGCSSIKTWGLCPTEKMDAICRKVKHPLSYYRIKGRRRK